MSEWFSSLVSSATQLADSIVESVTAGASAAQDELRRAQEEMIEEQRTAVEQNGKFASPRSIKEAASNAGKVAHLLWCRLMDQE